MTHLILEHTRVNNNNYSTSLSVCQLVHINVKLCSMDIAELPTSAIITNYLDTTDSYYPEEYYYLPTTVNSQKMSYIPNNPITTQYQQQPTQQQPVPQQQQQQQMSMLKRKMTLDLNTAKRARSGLFSTTGLTPGTAPVLSSPDFKKVQLSTPEIESLIMSTTNPNVLQTPTSVFFPKNVTEEQEMYAKGFEIELNRIRASDNIKHNSFGGDHDDSSASSYSTVQGNTSGNDFNSIVVKEEPQIVPEDDGDDELGDDSDDSDSMTEESITGSGTKISPIDMVSQEKIKLERKRQRNRLAASKCRKRKLEKIANLEDKVKRLKGENTELGNVLVKLRETVSVLKSQVMEHVQAGCPILVNFNNSSSYA